MNVFYQPWTLVIIGLSVELALLIGARFWPLKIRRKHLLIGPILIGLAFGLDYLVTTDTEKIEAVVATIVKASEEEKPEQIIACIGPTFRSSLHDSRELFAHMCRQLFSKPQIETNWLRDLQLELDKTKANVRITIVSRMDKHSSWAQWLPVAKTVWEIRLEKQPDKTWLIVRLELVELNNEPLDLTPGQLRKHLAG
jgi:hypothetical protein